MLNNLARVISSILNPIFLIFPLPYFLILRQTGNPLLAIKWTIFTALFTLSIGIIVFLAVLRKYFSDLDISRREQRPIFFFILTIFALVYLLALVLFHAPLSLYIALGGVFLSIAVFLAINMKVKVSIHVASITGLIFSMSVLFSGVFLYALFLIPLVAWARLRIKRHTESEVILGALVGIMIPLVIYLVFKVLLQISLSA